MSARVVSRILMVVCAVTWIGAGDAAANDRLTEAAAAAARRAGIDLDGARLGGELRPRGGNLDRHRLPEDPSASPSAPRPTPDTPAKPDVVIQRDGTLAVLHHDRVRFIGDLARADLTLSIRNLGKVVSEWERTFVIDKSAEIISAELLRAKGPGTVAKVLPAEQARRSYTSIRDWRERRDPLLVERNQRNRLTIAVWPLAPGEIVRVKLSFTSELHVADGKKLYHDVVRVRKERTATVTQSVVPAARFAPIAQWTTDPRTDVLAPRPVGLARDVPSGAWRVPGSKDDTNLAVNMGAYGARVALWRFDPARYLASHDIQPTRALSLRLVPVANDARSLVPSSFEALGDAKPVTARMTTRRDRLRYVVEVWNGSRLIHKSTEATELDRVRRGPALEDAVRAYHLGRLAAQVTAWAGDDEHRKREALQYVMDLGVLGHGTAGLAVPSAELRRLDRSQRRAYQRFGTLGARRGEADFLRPPEGSVPKRR